MMIYTLVRWQNKMTAIEVISSYSKKDLEAIKDILESTPIFGKVDRYNIEEEDIQHLTFDDAVKAKESRITTVISGANCNHKCIAFGILSDRLENHWGIVDKLLGLLKRDDLSPSQKLHDVEYYLRKIRRES